MKFLYLFVFLGLACMLQFAHASDNPYLYSQKHHAMAQAIDKYGANPFIADPETKDLEAKILNIAKARSYHYTDEDMSSFDQQSLAIMELFPDNVSSDQLMQDILSAKQGYAKIASEEYPAAYIDTNCNLKQNNAAFIREFERRATSFQWQFESGECRDGFAHGHARVKSDNGRADFTGTFHDGVMKEGIYHYAANNNETILQNGPVIYPGQSSDIFTAILRRNDKNKYITGRVSSNGKLNGFGTIIREEFGKKYVDSAGYFQNGLRHGFAVWQKPDMYGRDNFFYTRIGQWSNGEMNGLGAFTNNMSVIDIGSYKNGKIEGRSFSHELPMRNTDYLSRTGILVGNKYHGRVQKSVNGGPTETEYYNMGKITSEFAEDMDSGRLFATAAGLAVVGMSDLDATSKAKIGGAFAADTLGNGQGRNMAALKQNSQAPAQAAGSTNVVENNKTKGPMKSYAYHLQCPTTGVETTIDIPYRTQQCLEAAKNFARVYSCNDVTQEDAMQRCKQACGHIQCNEQ